MACVAKRSTTVKKAVKPITIVRRSTPEGGPCISMAISSKGTACGMSESSILQGKQCDTSLCFGSQSDSNHHAKSHVVMIFVSHHVADKQGVRPINWVLSPM